ncbi:hypothetical protein [Nocardioides sp. 1609]|uniref:hypothetical protein n=1 Tax=Nocardioides sp. 1609 TaxID=2508327 RepID=UPI00106F7258|nr:hypothetical protein [Nocardioides sp. 1609]
MTTTDAGAPDSITDIADEDTSNSFAPGGALSPAGREHAIRQALPILGRYFQKVGSAERLVARNALDVAPLPQTDIDQRLLGGLRLRAALASAEPVLDAIRSICRQPSFRYSLTKSESVGHLGGTLDVPAYVSRMYFDGGPTIYPISEVERSVRTPENQMTAYAAMWMIEELRGSIQAAKAPAQSPEARLATDLENQFRAAISGPTLAPCREDAALALTRGNYSDLMSRVEARLRRGEIGHGHHYQTLHALLTRLQTTGPTGHEGHNTWSFYDDAFDPRLFELWCLVVVAKALSEALADDLPTLDPEWTGSGLAFCWERPAGTLEMYTQKSLPLIDPKLPARWVKKGTAQPMRGIPDIVVRGLNRYSGKVRVALLDAKLKQRSSPPTEELYKLLGYFDNFGLTNDPQGAILFHDPATTETHTTIFTPVAIGTVADEGRGCLIATPLNPSDSTQTTASLIDVVDMMLSLLDLPAAHRNSISTSPDTGDSAGPDSEVTHEAHVHRIRDELRALRVQIHPSDLDASKRRMKTALGQATWSRLTEDAQDMLATAENVGFTMSEQADFSGPVLGAVCPLELVLDSELVAPAKLRLNNSDAKKIGFMLGQQIETIAQALGNGTAAHHLAIQAEATARGMNLLKLRNCLALLADLNRDHRRRAAHKEKLSSSDWAAVYQRVVTGDRLLVELVAALNVQPVLPPSPPLP